jgi:hypothetical protein
MGMDMGRTPKAKGHKVRGVKGKRTTLPNNSTTKTQCLPFCINASTFFAFRFSVSSELLAAKTRRWSSSRPIRPRVRLWLVLAFSLTFRLSPKPEPKPACASSLEPKHNQAYKLVCRVPNAERTQRAKALGRDNIHQTQT